MRGPFNPSKGLDDYLDKLSIEELELTVKQLKEANPWPEVIEVLTKVERKLNEKKNNIRKEGT
jgi:hypothetical protein